MQARQLWDGADGGLCSCVPRQEHLTRETVCWRRDGISHAIPEVEESQAWQARRAGNVPSTWHSTGKDAKVKSRCLSERVMTKGAPGPPGNQEEVGE